MLAFGLTQYNFGAVVLTLKAKGSSEELERNKYSVAGSVNVPLYVKTDGETSMIDCCWKKNGEEKKGNFGEKFH